MYDGIHNDAAGESGPTPGIALQIATLPRKSLRLATWNTASLFGTLAATGPRQTRKRRYLDDLLLANDVVALQETRGTPTDLTTLPPTHIYTGTFMPPNSAATSTSGGTVIAIRSDLHARATDTCKRVHMQRRAMTYSLHLGHWYHFCAVHVDIALTMLTRQRLLRDIAAYHARLSGITFLLGDWNFVPSDETHLVTDRGEVRSDSSLAQFFEDTFAEYLELREPAYTFRRLAREAGAPSTYSRIDRIYTSAHPSALAQFTAQAWVKGDLSARDAPSDHRAVEVSIRTRSKPPLQRLKPHVTQHCMFQAKFLDDMCMYDAVTDVAAKYDAIVAAARSVHRRVLPLVRIGPDPPPHSIADVSLSILTHVRDGRQHDAAQLARDTPRLSHTVGASGTVDVRKVYTTLQHSLDEATTRDIAALERSTMPELHKVAQRRKLRFRLEPYRLKRKRLTLHALYDRDGHAVTHEADVAALIAQEWAPVFAERTPIQVDMQFFLSYVPQGAGRSQWVWPKGEVAAAASRMPVSAPGPDGLPYSFWSSAGSVATDYLDEVAERATRGEGLPKAMLASHTVFPPKGEFTEESVEITRNASDLRPLTMMQTSTKLVASIANTELSRIASDVVAGNQRGSSRTAS